MGCSPLLHFTARKCESGYYFLSIEPRVLHCTGETRGCYFTARFPDIFIRCALLSLRSPLVLMFPWVMLEHEIAFSLMRCGSPLQGGLLPTSHPSLQVWTQALLFIYFAWFWFRNVLKFLTVHIPAHSAQPVSYSVYLKRLVKEIETYFCTQ